jgi:hypothetical protein
MNNVKITYLLLGMAMAIVLHQATRLINATTTTGEALEHNHATHQLPVVDPVRRKSTALQLRAQSVETIDQQQLNSTTTSHPEFVSAVESIGRLTNETEINNFTAYAGVVIAMKIHGTAFMPEVKQSLCLLDVAYNSRVLHDIIIFHTMPLDDKDILEVQQIVSPANITFVLDKMTLEEQIANMTHEQQQTLVDRCIDVNTTADITWHHRCRDDKFVMPIAYTWMSEFRSKQIWLQEALRPYKYMLWLDSDSYATMVWKHDPIEYMIQKGMVLLMANYAQGNTLGDTGVQQKLLQVYNKTLCLATLVESGVLRATYGTAENCGQTHVQQVHGFFHVTNLDFYRLPQNLYWYNVQIGDSKFSRVWDDQLAVVVPAAMLAPGRAAEMERVGLDLQVFHNGKIMGKRPSKGGGYKAFWRNEGATKFPEAQEKCGSYITCATR